MFVVACRTALRKACNANEDDEEPESVTLEKTPWKLHLTNPQHPLQVFIYFATHEEAKNHEDICISKGWTSSGIVWYN